MLIASILVTIVVDNILLTNLGFSKTCTLTNGAGWWEVDLGGDYTVQYVRIKNRMDCCSNRLDGVKVLVGGMECGIIEYEEFKFT